MASNKRSDVELVITAKNEATKTIDELVKSFDSLEAAGNNGGLQGFFKKLNQSTEELTERQSVLVNALKKVKDAQAQLGKAGKGRDKAINDQTNALDKVKNKLLELKAGYAEYEKSASQARTPAKGLTDQLENQQKKYQSLADTIQATRAKLSQSETSIDQNKGVDGAATSKIADQRNKVIELGRAWRETQQAIAAAQKALTDNSGNKDTSAADAKAAKARLDSLREQVKAADEFEKARRKEVKNSKKATREQVKAQLAATKQTKALRKERDAQIVVERRLREESKKSSKAFRDQEKSVNKLVTTAGKQKAAYEGIKKSLKEFEKAQKAASTERQQGQLDKLRASLKSLETQYQSTGDKIAATQGRINSASGPDPQSIKRFDALKAKIDETVTEIVKETLMLNKLQKEFNETGVSASKLAQAEQRLAQISDRLTKEQQQLADEFDKTGNAADRAGKKAQQFTGRLMGGNGSRQSLSFLQRIRGELLSITATYTGLYAVGGGIRSIYDAAVLTQKATARLSARFNGDTRAIGEEFKFVRAEANRLGLEYEILLEQYTKFITNIPEGTLNLEQIRFTFSGIAEAARVVGLSNDDVNATFLALGQIASKGALQLEELKGQLGERIPKAVELAAKGLSKLSGELITTEELLKRINKGEVTSDAIVALAAALKSEFGPELANALKSPQASLADFRNTLFDIRTDLVKSGFLDELVKGLKEVTEVMKTPEFREGAKELAGGIGGLLKLIVSLVKNFGEFKVILGTVIGAKVLLGFVGFISRLKDLIVFTGKTTGATKLLSASWAALGLTLKTVIKTITGFAAAFAAGFGIGTLLYDQIPEVRKFGAAIVGEFEKIKLRLVAGWDKIKAYFNVARGVEEAGVYDDIGKDLDKQLAVVEDRITQMFVSIDKEFSKKGDGDGPKILDPKKAKEQADAFSEEISKGLTFFRGKSNFPGLEKQFKKIGEAFTEESASTLSQRLKLIENEYTEFLQKLGKFQLGADDEILKIQDVLAAKVEDIEKKKADGRLEEVRANRQIADIRERAEKEIQILRNQKSALSGAAGKTKELIDLRKNQEIQKDIDERVKKSQKEINTLLSERQTKLQKINDLAEVNLITTEEQGLRLNKVNDDYIKKIREAVTEAKKLSDTTGNQDLGNFAASFDGFEELAQRKALIEDIKRLEGEINDTLDLRNTKIQTINLLRDSGAKTAAEAELEIRELYEENNLILEQMVNNALKLSQSLGDAATIARLNQVKAGLRGVTQELVSAEQINQQFASGFANAFDSFITGAQSAKDAFRQFIADFLRQIATAIIQALILKAITGAVGGGGGGIGGAIAAGVNHTGGIIGRTGKKRNVSPLLFANAIRYHSGGIAGLKPDEVPTILQKGEQVIPKGEVGKQAQSDPEIKIINMIESSSVLSEGLKSSQGSKAIMNFMRANKSVIKSVLA